MKTFLFPGQGSQAKGMGGDIFDDFGDIVAKADDILGYSIKELCLSDPRRELNKTQFTQPAIYTVNALSYLKQVGSGCKPDYVAGHSLGEFNALQVSGAFSFESGLKLVKKRGELMSRVIGGGMAAILNAEKEEIENILRENNLSSIDLANYNTSTQIVISGLRDEIIKAEPYFQKDNIEYYPLNTSGAFHSRHMEDASKEFESYLKRFKFSGLEIPVISNVSARPYKDGDILGNLTRQLTHSVKWHESILYLIGLGDMEFEEVTHSEMLSKMIGHIKNEVPTISSNTAIILEEDIEENAIDEGEKKRVTEQNDRGSDSAALQAPFKLPLAVEEVKLWNESNSVGTMVRSSILQDEELKTRTEATVLFGHRAAIYLEGFNGYFDLDEITLAEEFVAE